MLKRALCLATLALLPACSTTGVQEDFSFSDETENGLLIGSLTYEGGYSAYSIFFRSLDDQRTGWIQTGKGTVLIPYFPAGDFGEIGMKGDLFAIELPEGEYAVSSWAVSSGPARIEPNGKFDINFVIEARKALYIGNFNFRQIAKLGLTVTGVDTTYRDQFERDMKLFRKKYENIDSSLIFKGLEDGLLVSNLGAGGSTEWNLLPVIIPVY